MSIIELEIRPKEGLSSLLFGASMQAAENCFGKAQEKEDLEGTEEYKTIIWHYWEQGFSLFFDENENMRFSCVEIDNVNAVLWKKKIFEMKEEEIIHLFKSKGFVELETEAHEWGERRVSFDDALVDLYFEGKDLVSINYGALVDKKLFIFPN